MFRRFTVFALLITLFSLLPMASAQAQSCSPGCLAVSVYVSCADPIGQLPPAQGGQHFSAGISGPYYRQRFIPYTGTATHDGQNWRLYSFLETNHPTGTWSVQWTENSGPFAGWWHPGFPQWKVISSGGAASWTFFYYSDIC